MKYNLVLCATGILLIVSCSKYIDNTEYDYLRSDNTERGNKSLTIVPSHFADSAGCWHNQFMELCFLDETIGDSSASIESKKMRITELSVIFFSTRLSASELEIKMVAEDIFIFDQQDLKHQLSCCTDNERRVIYKEVLRLYKEAESMEEFAFSIDSLWQAHVEFIDREQDVRALLNLVHYSAEYWTHGAVLLPHMAKADPLTPNQRRIMNADGESGVQGGIGGMLTGGPWGAVVGCIVGGAIGSIWEACK